MDSRFEKIFFVGNGIDIGGGQDPLSKETFNNIKSIDIFDVGQGDANDILHYRKEESYDFVYSSHCLEHMIEPFDTILQWFSLVKDGGYMIIVVPDEDLYEQCIFPSQWNPDHRHTFTIFKNKSWSQSSINIVDLICHIEDCDTIKIELLNHFFDYNKICIDQTWGKSESGIEFILKKIKNRSL